MIPSLLGLIVMAVGLIMLHYAISGDVLGWQLPNIFPSNISKVGSVTSNQ